VSGKACTAREMPLASGVVTVGVNVPGSAKTPGASMLEILDEVPWPVLGSGAILWPRVIGMTTMANATISKQKDVIRAILIRSVFETKRVYVAFNICLSPSLNCVR